MNITELARKLKVPTKELREKLPQLGFDIGMKAIQIDDRTAQKVIEQWSTLPTEKNEEPTQEIENVETNEKAKKVIFLPPEITVHDFAEKLNLPVARVIKELIKNGIVASINEKIDYETANILSEDLGFEAQKSEKDEKEEKRDLERKIKLEKLLKKEKGGLKPRPPVVVVMGHVDHGKTLLLDTIRKTNIIKQESGGITQHIGAYQVEKNGRLITFIDTPGHEAFKSMRTRGGMVADIAILIIAADDHVQPQTLESIKIIQEEKLPFVVAINKIDKPEADVDRIKKELSEINLVAEDWGGDVICVPISAKTSQGIKELLDMVLLVADLNKDKLLANPNREAVGTIIESKVDSEAGPVATVLVHTGTLKIGDPIIVGNSYGKIRAMKNWKGQLIETAGPSMPTRFLGFKTAPMVGDILEVIRDPKEFKKRIKNYRLRKEISPIIRTPQEQGKKTLNIVLRADVVGSLEAISQSLEKIKNPEVKIEIVKKGLGDITEADVILAEASQALIIGFHIKSNPTTNLIAKDKNITIKKFEVIYELIDYLRQELSKLLSAEIIRTDLGQLKILAIFRTEKDGMIVGGKVIQGRVINGAKAEVTRENNIITRGNITQLQTNKISVDEVTENNECGIKFEGKPLIQKNDILNIFKEETKEKNLD